MGRSTRRDPSVSRRAFLKKGATAGVGATALAGLGARSVEAQNFWDRSADLVTIGAGTAGLAAAVSALDHGASVIMVEENVDIGGHGLCSGGNVHLGGGTSNQRKHGVEDSADQVYLDWVRHDHMQSRYSDRDLVRAFADENAATFEFLIENGVEFQDHLVGPTQASRARRQQRTVQWPIAAERVTHHPTPRRLRARPGARKERAGQGRRDTAAAQDDEHRPGEPGRGPRARHHRHPRRPHREHPGRTRASSSPPGAAPAT